MESSAPPPEPRRPIPSTPSWRIRRSSASTPSGSTTIQARPSPSATAPTASWPARTASSCVGCTAAWWKGWWRASAGPRWSPSTPSPTGRPARSSWRSPDDGRRSAGGSAGTLTRIGGSRRDPTATEEAMITITDTAAAKVKHLIAEEGNDELALRVAVRPGGCSGFSYEMFFDTDVTSDDLTTEYGGVRVVVDPSSAQLLEGATLDYKDGLQEAGFSINNPNAQRTCGCGSSFS